MGSRYSIAGGREIVLLKSFPCRYGKCSFCNYILDNDRDEDKINIVNLDVLKNVYGHLQALEVINSGSVFELPHKTLAKIKEIADAKNIHTLYFEIYYGYIDRLEEIRKFFPNQEIRFRMGLETFDNEFRKEIYNKNFKIDEKILKKLSKELYSVCLLVGVKGQTKEMIKRDIELGLKYFKSITINLFIDNGTKVKQDKDLARWIRDEFSYLKDNKQVELLLDNHDLGVFEQ